MSLNSIRHLLNRDHLDKIIKRLTFFVRIVLIVCILLIVVILMVMPFTNSDIDNNIDAFFFFSAFYSFIWGTIPSMIFLSVISFYNKYSKKTSVQPIRTEVKLVAINIIIILVTVSIVWFVRRNE
jgi:hypothetical protein